MLTEDEARKKWCPMARMLESHAERTSYNVSHREEQVNYGRCIASGCMAWRWITEAERRRVHHSSPESNMVNRIDTFELDGKWWRYEFTSTGSHGKFDQIYRVDAHAPTHGYCGAFGRPGDA